MHLGTLYLPTTRDVLDSTVTLTSSPVFHTKEIPTENVDSGERNLDGEHDDEATLQGSHFVPKVY